MISISREERHSHQFFRTSKRLEEIVVLFTSIEKGDNENVAKRAIDEVKASLDKLKVNRILIYPYAHLSSNLAKLHKALDVLKAMEKYAKDSGIETYRTPFGWCKQFSLSIKGHPLAEQSKVVLPEKVKEKKIDKIVTPIFDFPLMAKLSLGRKHWPKLDSSQREKFTKLFSERLKRAYWKKVALYKDEKILFKPKQKKNKTFLVPTELLYKDKKVAIIYKLRKTDKSWKIYDVEIQGVSVLLTYRSQFDEILSHGTVEDLLSRLEKPPDD